MWSAERSKNVMLIMTEPTDGLSDTSEAAMSARLVRFRQRLANRESPLDHALNTLLAGCQDLNDAIWSARSKDELRAAREAVSAIHRYMDTAESIMLTCEEHWKDGPR